MNITWSSPFIFIFTIILGFLSERVLSQTLAITPPRGWNTYDSFSWTISEDVFLQNAKALNQRLQSYGYEYMVVDFLWYRRLFEGASVDSLWADVIDDWGRMIPDPERWPSSTGGKGFSEVAKKLHDLGLKFGIHVMKGISVLAFIENTLILDIRTGKAYEEAGKVWHAQDIGIKERPCGWMPNGFMSVNTSLGAGIAFLRSVYDQYYQWGVDFVKHDCVFGKDFDLDEIMVISEILKRFDDPMIYSLSPGIGVTPHMAKQIAPLVNMYRVTENVWDTWGDIASHFDVSRDFSVANLIGAEGLLGKSWPDLDMLPFGWLTDPDVTRGPHRNSQLTLDEFRTQMTLWSIARSPLMLGGDLRKLDDELYGIITQSSLMEINKISSNNMEYPYITSRLRGQFFEHHPNLLTRKLEDEGVPKELVLGLLNCQDFEAKGWFMKALDKDHELVCWRPHSGSKNVKPFCLNKTEPLLHLDENVTYSGKYRRKLQLHAKNREGFCFDDSSMLNLSSKKQNIASISPCKPVANQMWELSSNGTLVNSYSASCSSIKAMKDNAVDEGIRAWIATGKAGEVYLAFFNLNPIATNIATHATYLSKLIPDINYTSCTYKEVWSGRYYGKVYGILSATPVNPHGCALFILTCT